MKASPSPPFFPRCFKSRFQPSSTRQTAKRIAELPVGPRWFRVCYDPLQTDPDNESASVLIVTDITDQKKLHETLKLSERLAATGRLAHVIAHEINNPLEAMSNLLFLAAAGTPETHEETQSYVHQASAELVRISRITKQVLAYHRETANPELTSASEIAEGVIAMFSSGMQLRRTVLKLRLDCTEKILVHPGEIRQVLSNLISNALDAVGDSGGTLQMRCISSVHVISGTRGIRFIISDSGTGIPPHALPRIFEAFYTTKEDKGSGIGLWLSSEVIEKHKGYIRFRTRTHGPHRGTLADVFIPLAPATPPTEATPQP